jgi:hypothetical protein
MKLYFDRERSVFPTSVRLSDIIGDQFAPVICYELEEPVTAFFGARLEGTEYLLWEQTLSCPNDEYPCEGEVALGIETTATMADFLRDLMQVRPSTVKLMSYQWILGYSTGTMEGFVSDTWDASTRIVAGEICWGTIAAVVAVGAVFVGVIMSEEGKGKWRP